MVEERGRQASIEGFANELIAAGILMKRYQNVSLVDLPLSPYDIVAVLKDSEEKETIIRAQVKTAKTKVDFKGGIRGGVDRTYKSDVKAYRQSTKTSDVVVGISADGPKSYDLYFVPTILIEALNQGSISLSKIAQLKNNYEMFERCKDSSFVLASCREYGILGDKKTPQLQMLAPQAGG